jgi:hypothetical protein
LTQNKRRKRMRQAVIGGVTALALIAITIVLAQLAPAAPSVERDTQWIQPVGRSAAARRRGARARRQPVDPARLRAHG